MGKECEHTGDMALEDETQHYIQSDTFWFTMRCDTCGEVVKVLAGIKELKNIG